MSRSGMLLHSDVALSPGDRVTAAVDWPAGADERIRLHLIVAGYVIWGRGGWAGIAITRHEFRQADILSEPPLVGAASASERRPILRRLVLVHGDQAVRNLVARVLAPNGFVIWSTDERQAKNILRIGFPPVSLIVTDNPALLRATHSDIAVLLTLPKGEDPPSLPHFTRAAVVNMPLTCDALREALKTIPAIRSFLFKASSDVNRVDH